MIEPHDRSYTATPQHKIFSEPEKIMVPSELQPADSDSEESDSEGYQIPPRLNDPALLSKGVLRTTKGKSAFTIFLVGETGVGKTCFLSLIGNVLAGNKSRDYVDVYDPSNEEGGSQSQSQTKTTMDYEIVSQNGVTLRMVDTPGLADTRGVAQDALHKASIAKFISDRVDTVNGVIVLANGTCPRLGVATDYTLTTLSSIFPHTLTDNIAFVFTNVPSPLSWNFEDDSLPIELRHARRFILDNPVALRKKYVQLKQSKIAKETLRELNHGLKQGEEKAYDMLSRLFDWLDGRVAQPTRDILVLYERSRAIEMKIQNALALMQQANTKRVDLEKITRDIDKADLDIDTLKGYEKVIKRRRHMQVSTDYHNTVCSVPDCYSNCHEYCDLKFSLDPRQLAECSAMEFGGENCMECGHPIERHLHFNAIWVEVEEDEHVIDEEAQTRYHDAKTEKIMKEMMKAMVIKAIGELSKSMEETIVQVGDLAAEYASLSLSGSFDGQIEKSIKLMSFNIDKMRKDGSSLEMIERLEKCILNMRAKLNILKEARQKTRCHPI